MVNGIISFLTYRVSALYQGFDNMNLRSAHALRVAARSALSGSPLRSFVTEPLEARRLLSSGTLDTTYGQQGVATITMPGSTLSGSTAAVQPDGKLLVSSQQGSNQNFTFSVTRLNTNGTLDTTFGNGGTATAGFYGENELLDNSHLALQSDGRILLTAVGDGLTGSNSPSQQVDVERFLSTGLADPSFGTNGIINLSRLGMINVGAITLDSSGRILVAGSGTVNDVTSLILTRLTTAGAVDTTFGSYGTAVLPLANHSVFASSIAVESDGSTLIGAQTETDGGFAMNWLLSHVTASGAVDTAFGTNGVAIFPQFTNWPPSSIEPLSGGSFLAGGMLNSTAGIARFTPTGTLDTTFGSDGVAAVGSGQLELFSAQVESDGTIVCGGGGTDDAFVSRLLASGATDTSFGTTFGVSSTSLPASVSESIDGDGSFAIGADGSGYVVNSSTAVPSFYVTKYLDVAPATVTSTPAPSGAGVVSGLVYNDAYASGTYATGDAGLSGRVVYADLNGDGQLDDDEPSTLTISSGAYTLANVPSGSAIIRAVAPATYFNTGSPAGVQTVTVTTGSATSGVNFGQYQYLTVSGTVYEDADGNGRRSFNDPTPSGGRDLRRRQQQRRARRG